MMVVVPGSLAALGTDRLLYSKGASIGLIAIKSLSVYKMEILATLYYVCYVDSFN